MATDEGFCDPPDARSYTIGLLLFLFTFFFPGITTMICAIIDDCRCNQIIVGILQLITTPLLVGYIWAIVWSCKSWGKANLRGNSPLMDR